MRRKRQTNNDVVNVQYNVITDTKSSEAGEPDLDVSALSDLVTADNKALEADTNLVLGGQPVRVVKVIIGM